MLDLDSNFPRLLGCSSSLTIPLGFTSRFLVSSTDVIHSFSMPSLALKVDALPGRINQIFSLPVMGGVFFGQCSEICGSNHSFIPIILKVVDYDLYSRYSTISLLNDVLEVDNVNI
ncbi:Cytochrome-c oxidase [Handroanthus impetiginosus]|uniref:Cytochrome c oxidase polypeptide II n=1 Tax=Handroanthus impetiginosus TaxID=429701 RepID=A0A2G9FV85_9LAMI|nr:Cytochrome-c oxidase [Handroanthus impetiginosus]